LTHTSPSPLRGRLAPRRRHLLTRGDRTVAAAAALRRRPCYLPVL